MNFRKWEQGMLKDVATIIMGQSPKSETCNAEGNGIPLLNGPTEFGDIYPIPFQYTLDPKKIAQKGDILFCVRGSTVGRMNIADQIYAIGRGLASISPKDKKCFGFVKAVLNYKLGMLLHYANGSTFPNISKGMLFDLPITIPPIEEQVAISDIMITIDNKIELNIHINEVLENIIDTIFRAYFIDFEPFTSDELVDSELGMIPKGWNGILENIANVNMGQSPPSNTYNTAQIGLPFYQGIKDFGIKFPSASVYCSDPVKIAEKGQILLSVRAPVGDVNISITRCCIGRGIASLTMKNNQENHYLYYYLKSNKSRWQQYETGSVFKAVTKKSITNFPVVIPPSNVIIEFNKIVSTLDSMILNNFRENLYLAQLRDTLLPKLISGEIRIPVGEEEA